MWASRLRVVRPVNRSTRRSFLHERFQRISSVLKQLPAFPLRPSERAVVLSAPSGFYDTLLVCTFATHLQNEEGIEGAEERITFASLYLGTGPLCTKLVGVDSAHLTLSYRL